MIHLIISNNLKIVPVDRINILYLLNNNFKLFWVGHKEVRSSIAYICIIFQQIFHCRFTNKGIIRIVIIRRLIIIIFLICFISHNFKQTDNFQLSCFIT